MASCEVVLRWTVYVVFAILGFPGNGYGHTINDTNALLEDLFVTRKYNKYVRPVTDQLQPLQVTIEFHVTSLRSLDLNSGEIAVRGFLQLTWTDEQLTWNPLLYGGLAYLPINPDNVWLPKLSQNYRTFENSYSTSSAAMWISFQGYVLLIWLDTFATTCEIDIFLYPFDSHQCLFNFLSFVHPENELFFAPESDITYETYYDMIKGNEWSINMESCKVKGYNAGTSMSAYDCQMQISRRPSFGIHHVVMPFLCLTILTFAVFWTPINSGERISFSVTLFLAYVVTLSSLTVEIPRNNNTSLYSRLLVFMNVMNVACVVVSVIVTRLSLTSHAHIPRPLQKLTKCITKRRRKSAKVFSKQDEDQKKSETTDVHAFEHDNADVSETAVTWLEVAQAVDTLMFLLVLMIVILMIIVVISVGIRHINSDYQTSWGETQ